LPAVAASANYSHRQRQDLLVPPELPDKIWSPDMLGKNVGQILAHGHTGGVGRNVNGFPDLTVRSGLQEHSFTFMRLAHDHSLAAMRANLIRDTPNRSGRPDFDSARATRWAECRFGYIRLRALTSGRDAPRHEAALNRDGAVQRDV
jgi:hypothetical protein